MCPRRSKIDFIVKCPNTFVAQSSYPFSNSGPINRFMRALARVAKEVKFHSEILTSA